TPDQVREILIKVLDAVDLVHRNDLLHRDISPDNILLDKWGSPVLIDFGAAREEASRETRAVSSVLVVKDGYSPQEFYFAGGKQGPSSDLYALGATFYHLISGEAPPNSQTRMAEFAGNNPDPCEPLVGRFAEYDQVFLESIDKAMNVLPKGRIQTAQEWLDLINPKEQQRVRRLRVKTSDVLGQTLSKLVNETNEYVLNSEPREGLERKGAAKAETKEPAVSQPEWVDEFNRETSEAFEDEKAEASTIGLPEAPGLIAAPPKKKKRGLLRIFGK
ncbi:MAG: protein kinase, partial [Pseudomonadota bacterium]